MFKTVIVALSGALIAAASPALAADARPAEPAATTATNATDQAPAARPKATLYCVKDTVTGSRIQHKTCLTREQWLKDGFDPLAQ